MKPVNSRPAVFISCLGTTDYRQLSYAPYQGEPADPPPLSTRFVQIARLGALAHRCVELQGSYILVTEGEQGSKARNWLDNGHSEKPRQGLQNCATELGLPVTPVVVPSGANEDEYWQIFDLVASLIPEHADVYVDLTHGFRTLPLLVTLALEYVEKVKDACIVEVTYGADQNQTDGLAPTWNLEPFLAIRTWADAAQSFIEYGDTRPLARVAKEPVQELRRELRAAMPRELGGLHQALNRFGEAIQKCHSPGVAQAALGLRRLLKGAAHDCAGHLRLKPLGLILKRVGEELAEFPEEITSSVDDLVAQAAAARWCVKHGLTIQALTFLREAFVGVLEVALELTSEQADVSLGLLGQLARGRRPEHELLEAVESLRAEPPVDQNLWNEFESLLHSLAQSRNKLNHAYRGYDDCKPLSEKDLEDKGGRWVDVLRRMVISLKGDAATVDLAVGG